MCYYQLNCPKDNCSIIYENKFVNALVLLGTQSVSARVYTPINTPNQSACGPTTTAVRRVDVHQCQGHEVAPDAAWLWVRVQELIISNNNMKCSKTWVTLTMRNNKRILRNCLLYNNHEKNKWNWNAPPPQKTNSWLSWYPNSWNCGPFTPQVMVISY